MWSSCFVAATRPCGVSELARPSQLDPEITNFCPLEGENASRIKG